MEDDNVEDLHHNEFDEVDEPVSSTDSVPALMRVMEKTKISVTKKILLRKIMIFWIMRVRMKMWMMMMITVNMKAIVMSMITSMMTNMMMSMMMRVMIRNTEMVLNSSRPSANKKFFAQFEIQTFDAWISHVQKCSYQRSQKKGKIQFFPFLVSDRKTHEQKPV